jgi:hypothetical protein
VVQQAVVKVETRNKRAQACADNRPTHPLENDVVGELASENVSMDAPAIPLIGERAHEEKVEFQFIIEKTVEEARSTRTFSIHLDVPYGELAPIARDPQRYGDRPVSVLLE